MNVTAVTDRHKQLRFCDGSQALRHKDLRAYRHVPSR